MFKDLSFKLSTALYEDLDDSTIRSKIIKLKLTHNLTQLEFAKKIHRGFGRVTKWEQGLTNPSPEALEDIINIFKLNSNYFI
ncbi:MAG: helix-turn-helix domain-containing protein [Clostridium sp.]